MKLQFTLLNLFISIALIAIASVLLIHGLDKGGVTAFLEVLTGSTSVGAAIGLFFQRPVIGAIIGLGTILVFAYLCTVLVTLS
jgi:hypothetical protein